MHTLFCAAWTICWTIMLPDSLCVVFISALHMTTYVNISVGTGLEEVVIRLWSFWHSATLHCSSLLTISISCTLLVSNSRTESVDPTKQTLDSEIILLGGLYSYEMAAILVAVLNISNSRRVPERCSVEFWSTSSCDLKTTENFCRICFEGSNMRSQFHLWTNQVATMQDSIKKPLDNIHITVVVRHSKCQSRVTGDQTHQHHI